MSAASSRHGAEFLARCVSSTTGNPELEQIRERGAEAMLAIHRLVKITLLHALDNDAVARTIDQSHAILRDFASLAGGAFTVTFVDDTIFVSGQLLRASRMVYELATELGELLGRCGVSEIAITSEVTREGIAALATATAKSLRDSLRATPLVDARIQGLTLRKIEGALARRGGDEGVPLEGRFLRLYASGLVVLRRFFDGVAAGSSVVPHRVKRVAQAFVTLAQEGDAGLIALTTMANAHRDDAGRALQTAIVALALGRQITTTRLALARLTMTAMLADVGRVRLAGTAGRDRLVPLDYDAELSVPSVASAISITTGGVNPQSALRTVVVFETTWLEREPLLGPVYAGKLPPLLQAGILRVARAVHDRLAPRDTSRPVSMLDALRDVARQPGIDRTLLKLLVRAVGLTPTGSVVELETGEWAVVVGPSANGESPDRPRLRVVIDRRGQVLDPPQEIDLGLPPAGRRYPAITRVVEPTEARFNVARTLVAG